MSIQHDYTLLCEFARQEAGGKFIIIGLFPNGIGTPMIPFPLPYLTFFSVLKAETLGEFKFRAQLRPFSGGPFLAEVHGAMQVVEFGPVIIPVTLANMQFRETGTYTWSLHIEGQDPFLTEFRVFVIPPQQVGGNTKNSSSLGVHSN